MRTNKEVGQAVIVLLLAMLVILAIGLAVIQRSLTDVTTSTQTDQSTRAFSAAEAGIERAISLESQGSLSDINNYQLDNNSAFNVKITFNLPGTGQALELPELTREEVGHFWLSNPSSPGAVDANLYGGTSLRVYWGDKDLRSDINAINTPAIEVNLISLSGSAFVSNKFYFDPISTRRINNGFSDPACNAPLPDQINTSDSPNTTVTDRLFRCMATINNINTYGTPVLIRTRLFYANSGEDHPIAIKPVGSCGALLCTLPVQAKVFTSTGKSGQSQRTVKVFRQENVVPQIFDFAIFSTVNIEK
ncbi:pilus assembly PilX N-terminal domain-containing protein [Candidatus Daviesbacteria bacterium]|nr:pilus assembly PilX N-terminal domain-containing protein [Candidatus Daviesbacteria bacterium]